MVAGMTMLLYFAVIPTVTVVVSLLLAWLFVRKDKALIGYLCGLVPILGVWAAAEWMVVRACAACKGQGLCCEWTGIGVITYAFIAILAILVYSALSLGFAFLRKRIIAHPPPLSAGSRRRQILLLVLYMTLLLASTGGVGAFACQKLFDLGNRGLLVHWQHTKYLGQAQTAFAAGDRITAEGTGGLCTYGFIVAQPPAGVTKRVRSMWCALNYRQQTQYVILQDGSYWMWHHEIYGETILVSNIVTITLGAIAGFLGGIRLAAAILTRRRDNG
jgi:hypothetical protein